MIGLESMGSSGVTIEIHLELVTRLKLATRPKLCANLVWSWVVVPPSPLAIQPTLYSITAQCFVLRATFVRKNGSVQHGAARYVFSPVVAPYNRGLSRAGRQAAGRTLSV